MSHELLKQDALEKMKIERLERKEVAKGSILTYCHDTVRIPNGNIRIWDYIYHQGAAAVLPVEPTKEAAIRELEEETGFCATDVSFLMAFYPTVAYSGEKIDIYLAKGLKRRERHLDADEFINVEAWDLKELMEMIFSGRLNDGKTVAAVSAYAYLTK